MQSILRYSADKPGELKNKIQSEALNLANNRAGTLFAVYNFLENELGIKWIKPGDDGIFYQTQAASYPGRKGFSLDTRIIAEKYQDRNAFI